jgi:hypothetical protein
MRDRIHISHAWERLGIKGTGLASLHHGGYQEHKMAPVMKVV